VGAGVCQHPEELSDVRLSVRHASPNPITGIVEGNIFQETSHVSSDADVLAVAAVDRLINTKAVMVDGQPMKIILSLKQDFTYPYANVPPFGRVPTTIEEIG
jgi:hypothetical protein